MPSDDQIPSRLEWKGNAIIEVAKPKDVVELISEVDSRIILI